MDVGLCMDVLRLHGVSMQIVEEDSVLEGGGPSGSAITTS